MECVAITTGLDRLFSTDNAAFSIVALLWMLAFGGAIGSFLNVVVYRWPRGRSIVHPGSQCPRCGHAIRAWDNVPVLAWLWLRGRCRDCQAPIASRYPTVEFFVALLFASLGWIEVLRSGGGVEVGSILPLVAEPWSLSMRCGLWAFHLLMLCTLLAAGLIRFDGLRVPRLIWYPALIVGVLSPNVWPWLLPGTPHVGMLEMNFGRTQHVLGAIAVVVLVLMFLRIGATWRPHLEPWLPQVIESPLPMVAILSLFLDARSGVLIAAVSMILAAAVSRFRGRPLADEMVAVGVAWGWIVAWPWLCHTFPLLKPSASDTQHGLLVIFGAMVIGLLFRLTFKARSPAS